MNKQELIQLLQNKNVITKNNKRKFCWKENFDDECKNEFNKFKVNYRTEEEAWFCLLNDIEPYHCEVCGGLAKFTGTKKTKYPGYNTTCENCSPNKAENKLNVYKETINKRTNDDRKKIIEKTKKTRLEKYGDENYTLFGSKKFKETLKEKYGSETYNNRDKYKETCLNRYGVTCNLSLNSSERSQRIWNEKYDEIISKIKETNLNNLGVEFAGQNNVVIDKIVNKKKVNVTDIEKQYNCTQQRKLFKKYGQGWKSLDLEKIVIGGRKFISNDNIPLIESYISTPHTNLYVSNKEKDLLNYIKEIYFDEIKENVTNVIANNNHRYYELDIYLPKLNIAFEFNGSYWHSLKFKDKYYHQRKTILCYEQGVQLIHIYEYDWDKNINEVKKHIYELLSGYDCSQYNWISLNKFKEYILSEPNEIIISDNVILYDEGNFIKKKIN